MEAIVDGAYPERKYPFLDRAAKITGRRVEAVGLVTIKE
jgi:hypothetical protein